MSNAKLNIEMCRASDDRVYIVIGCDNSHSKVLELDVDLEQFAYLVTGRSLHDVPAKVKNLDKIGKKRESEECTYVLSPNRGMPSRGEAQYIMENEVSIIHPGWEVDTYMGSQKSITQHKSGGWALNYRIHRYVEIDHER